jgi:hypothetical protein
VAAGFFFFFATKGHETHEMFGVFVPSLFRDPNLLLFFAPFAVKKHSRFTWVSAQ